MHACCWKKEAIGDHLLSAIASVVRVWGGRELASRQSPDFTVRRLFLMLCTHGTPDANLLGRTQRAERNICNANIALISNNYYQDFWSTLPYIRKLVCQSGRPPVDMWCFHPSTRPNLDASSHLVSSKKLQRRQ